MVEKSVFVRVASGWRVIGRGWGGRSCDTTVHTSSAPRTAERVRLLRCIQFAGPPIVIRAATEKSLIFFVIIYRIYLRSRGPNERGGGLIAPWPAATGDK